ncbi:gcn5-related n-acetyltransferase [gamma proteobacterium HdN1]|nr:gcn5-related n-acetyltransferase [gamma proteobacterium HdN1]
MGTNMEIREATVEDALSIANIHAESWRRTYGQVLTWHYLEHVAPSERERIWTERLSEPKPGQYVLVAQVDDEVIGFGCAFLNGINELGAYLDNLHVALPHQRAGVGRALIQKIAQKCQESDPHRGMCLLVNQDNANAQAFYLRIGATNTRTDVWNAPDGSVVPTYWFSWNNVGSLAHG